MFELLNVLNDYLWTYVVVTLLVFCALYFTLRLKGVQFRMIGNMIKVIVEKPGDQRIGAFQAFAVSLSSRVGTGNIRRRSGGGVLDVDDGSLRSCNGICGGHSRPIIQAQG